MKKFNLISLAIYSLFAGAAYANTLPQNGNVTSGEANITTQGTEMIINQSSPRVHIDWQSFDIGKENTVEFKQPSARAVAYNRVQGGNASQIQGKLKANGRVFLANPNGVIFTKGAEVNVGAILATTKELQNASENINNENLKFVRVTQNEGEILNQGKISANGENGFIVLVGDKVKNEGELKAKNFEQTTTKKERVCSGGDSYYCDSWYADYYGYYWYEEDVTRTVSTPAQIILGSGDSFELELGGDRATAVNVSLDSNTLASLVQNKGLIVADNGYVELTARGADQALDAVVNNDGLVKATSASIRNGKITLSAPQIQMGEKSDIYASQKLEFTSPERRGQKQIKVTSQKGAKILAKETEIKVDKLDFSGEFARGENEQENFYSGTYERQSNLFNIELPGKINIGDQSAVENSGSFISNTALASMLGNSSRVNLKSTLDTSVSPYNYGGFDWTGNFKVSHFNNTDSLLSLNTSNGLNIHQANIQSENGRLMILAQLWDYKTRLPENVNAKISISDSSFDLANGSIGLGRSGRNADYLSNIASTEDEQRSYFDVSLKNVQLGKIDDFVIAGGLKKVSFDNVQHQGRMNLSIHGGNSRHYGKLDDPKTGWEYGIKDLEERISRSEKDQDCERCRRWKSSSELDDNINREFLDVTDSWIVDQNRQHLDTSIQISNSNLGIKDGFLHFMAKDIQLTNSNIKLNFAKNWKFDDSFSTIPKVSINGNMQLDNSHLNIQGANIDKKFGTAAGLFFVGDLLGKNKSSLFIKSDDGYTVRTNGNSHWRGEKGKDDLKVTILNMGNSYDPAKYANGVDITADYPELGNTGFSMAATRAKVLFENLSLTIIAPNGAPAYYSSENLGFETKNADFSYYERPRTYKTEEASIRGVTNKLNLTNKQLARLLDGFNGVQGTNLSTGQSQQSAENKTALNSELALQPIEDEKDVQVQVCIEGEECKNMNLGNQHSEATVNVGEVK